MLGPVVAAGCSPSPAGRPLWSFLGLVWLCRPAGCLNLFLGLDHLEEGVAEQLLLQVLLEVEQRHVQQIHRLVQAD